MGILFDFYLSIGVASECDNLAQGFNRTTLSTPGQYEGIPALDLGGALKPVMTRHMSAIFGPSQAGDLMRSIDSYQGQLLTRTALTPLACLFQRPGNIRQMAWGELDLEAGMWTIPSDKMKCTEREKVNGRPHCVLPPPRAVAALTDLQPLTGQGRDVFPSLISNQRPMS